MLLDALPDMPRDVRIWVAGDGPDTDRLKRRTSGDPRVEWLGRISDAEKASRLRGATVYCAPSLRGESFGVVLLEAMAAGVPIVCSDLPGYRKVVRPGADQPLRTKPRAPGMAMMRPISDAVPTARRTG